MKKNIQLRHLIILLFLNVLFLGCQNQNKDNTTIEKNKKLFTLLSAENTGINFSNDIVDSQEANILKYSNFYGGAGVGVGDFNKDGLLDIYFAGNLVPDKLYLNRGNFKFEDVTATAGILDDKGWSTGVTVADVNNDGYLDIYVSRELYDDRPDLRLIFFI